MRITFALGLSVSLVLGCLDAPSETDEGTMGTEVPVNKVDVDKDDNSRVSHSSTTDGPEAEIERADFPIASPKVSVPNEFRVTASEFAKEFVKDEKAALAKYSDQWVELRCRFLDETSVAYDFVDLWVDLPEDRTSRWIYCELPRIQTDAIRRLSITQEFTLIGRVKGINEILDQVSPDWISLTDCNVVKVGHDPSIKISALELTKAFAENMSAGEAKYDGQPVTVTGTISNIQTAPNHVFELNSYASKSVSTVLWLYVESFGSAKHKVGDTVVVKGTVTPDVLNSNDPSTLV